MAERFTVIDSNALRSEALRRYLGKSQTNFAVLTDYVAMEAYKAKTLGVLSRSMEIVGEFPRQVIVLKGTNKICGLKPKARGLRKRMICPTQTGQFHKFIEAIKRAQNGDTQLQRSFELHRRAASMHMDKVLDDATRLPSTFPDMAESFTDEELKILRSGRKFSRDIVMKLRQSILVIAATHYRDHPGLTQGPPRGHNLQHSYIFRHSVCSYWWALKWIRTGGAQMAKPERIRNDLVDITFATYATFFDGILTEDKNLTELYFATKYILGELFKTYGDRTS